MLCIIQKLYSDLEVLQDLKQKMVDVSAANTHYLIIALASSLHCYINDESWCIPAKYLHHDLSVLRLENSEIEYEKCHIYLCCAGTDEIMSF